MKKTRLQPVHIIVLKKNQFKFRFQAKNAQASN